MLAVYIEFALTTLVGLAAADRRIAELSLPVYPELGDPAVEKLTSTWIVRQFSRQTDIFPEHFKLVAYATQETRYGLNYFAKIQLGDANYCHLRVFQPRNQSDPPQLKAFMLNMLFDDPLVYFLASGTRRASAPKPKQPLHQRPRDGPRTVAETTRRDETKRPQFLSSTFAAPIVFMLQASTTLPPVLIRNLTPRFAKKASIRQSPPTFATTTPSPPPSELTRRTRGRWRHSTPARPNQGLMIIAGSSQESKAPAPQPRTTSAYMVWPDLTTSSPRPSTTESPTKRRTVAMTTNGWQILPGGGHRSLSIEKPGKAEQRDLLSRVRGDYMAKTSVDPVFFDLVSYRSRTEQDGTTYFMKVYVDYNRWAHMRLFHPSSPPEAKPLLMAVQPRKGLFDPITYFRADDEQPATVAVSQPLPMVPQSVAPQTVTDADFLSPSMPADQSVSSIVRTVQSDFMRLSRTAPSVYAALMYREFSLLNGTIYFVKAQTGVNSFVHLRIFVPRELPHSPMLQGYQLNKSLLDLITYFEGTHSLQAFRTTTTSSTTPRPVYEVNIPESAGGGWGQLSKTYPAGPDVQRLVMSIKPQFVTKVYMPQMFEAMSYRLKLVAGELYFVKVKISSDETAHLRIFKPLPYSTDRSVLEAWQLGKDSDDRIDFFGPSNEPLTSGYRPVVDDSDLNQLVIFTAGNRVYHTTTSTPPSSMNRGQSAGMSIVHGASMNTGQLVKAVKPQFLAQSVFNPPMFAAVTERIHQGSPGLIHFVKVQINTSSFVHLKIMVRKDAPPRLESFDIGKTRDERIEFF